MRQNRTAVRFRRQVQKEAVSPVRREEAAIAMLRPLGQGRRKVPTPGPSHRTDSHGPHDPRGARQEQPDSPLLPLRLVHLACKDSRYEFRFAMRIMTIASSDLLTDRNSGPHTGMSLVPCTGTSAPWRSMVAT